MLTTCGLQSHDLHFLQSSACEIARRHLASLDLWHQGESFSFCETAGYQSAIALKRHQVHKEIQRGFGHRMFIYHYLSLSIYLSIHPSFLPSFLSSILPSFHLSIYLSICLSIYRSIFLSFFPIYLFIYLFSHIRKRPAGPTARLWCLVRPRKSGIHFSDVAHLSGRLIVFLGGHLLLN